MDGRMGVETHELSKKCSSQDFPNLTVEAKIIPNIQDQDADKTNMVD